MKIDVKYNGDKTIWTLDYKNKSYFWLVHKYTNIHVGKYNSLTWDMLSFTNYDESFSYGLTAFEKACKTYDKDKSTKFSTWLIYCLRHEQDTRLYNEIGKKVGLSRKNDFFKFLKFKNIVNNGITYENAQELLNINDKKLNDFVIILFNGEIKYEDSIEYPNTEKTNISDNKLDEIDMIQGIVKELLEDYQDLYYYIYKCDYSIKETAKELNEEENVIRVRKQRLIKKIRERIEED